MADDWLEKKKADLEKLQKTVDKIEEQTKERKEKADYEDALAKMAKEYAQPSNEQFDETARMHKSVDEMKLKLAILQKIHDKLLLLEKKSEEPDKGKGKPGSFPSAQELNVPPMVADNYRKISESIASKTKSEQPLQPSQKQESAKPITVEVKQEAKPASVVPTASKSDPLGLLNVLQSSTKGPVKSFPDIPKSVPIIPIPKVEIKSESSKPERIYKPLPTAPLEVDRPVLFPGVSGVKPEFKSTVQASQESSKKVVDSVLQLVTTIKSVLVPSLLSRSLTTTDRANIEQSTVKPSMLSKAQEKSPEAKAESKIGSPTAPQTQLRPPAPKTELYPPVQVEPLKTPPQPVLPAIPYKGTPAKLYMDKPVITIPPMAIPVTGSKTTMDSKTVIEKMAKAEASPGFSLPPTPSGVRMLGTIPSDKDWTISGLAARLKNFGADSTTLGMVNKPSPTMMDRANKMVDSARAMFGEGGALANIGPGLKEVGQGAKRTFESERFGDIGSNFFNTAASAASMVPGGEIAAGVLKFSAALYSSIEVVRKWADNLHAANMSFAEFSGSMSQVQAESDVRRMLLSQQRGERRAPSAKRLAEARDELDKQTAVVEDLWAEVKADILTPILNILSAGMVVNNKIAEVLYGIKSNTDNIGEGNLDDVTKKIVEEGTAFEKYGRPGRFPRLPGDPKL